MATMNMNNNEEEEKKKIDAKYVKNTNETNLIITRTVGQYADVWTVRMYVSTCAERRLQSFSRGHIGHFLLLSSPAAGGWGQNQ